LFVYFKKGEDKHSDEFEINLDSSNEDLKYIVTGLKVGKWTITSNGEVIDEKLVSEQSDVLTFEGKSGAYKLTYESANVENKDFFFINNMSEEIGNQVSVKINNEMITFENIPIITDNATPLVCLEEYLKFIGITPVIANENKVSFTKDLREITFETGKKSFNVNGANLPLNDTVISHNGKVYISPLDAQGQFGTIALYNDIGGVLNVDIKTYEVPSDNILTVKKNDGGNVLPGGFVVAKDNSPVDITITPDDGYYVDEVLFNGTPYGVYSQLGVVTLRTPEITENSTLENYNVFEIEAGDIILIDKRELHMATNLDGWDCQRIVINFNDEFFSECDEDFKILLECFKHNHIKLPLANKKQINSLFNKILREYNSDEVFSKVLLKNYICELLAIIYRSIYSNQIVLLDNDADTTIEKAIRYIYNNFNKKISLKEVADICHMNPSYFSRLFKNTTGINLVSYINTVRIKNAALLLSDTDKTILEISQLCGFDNVQHFCGVFKKAKGISALRFRKERNMDV